MINFSEEIEQGMIKKMAGFDEKLNLEASAIDHLTKASNILENIGCEDYSLEVINIINNYSNLP